MNWIEECRGKAIALTKEKRQEFLDYIWKGLNLGDAYKKANITFDEANGIMNMNICEASYLRRESK